jgi:glycerol-3-phosphate dehydrogenase
MSLDTAADIGRSCDVLVVGAGVVGAFAALEAARRGLRTVLVDAGDFGGGASANCLKIVHGGLRYVQHLDVRRMRESIAERRMWLRSAPHLVEPLPVMMPTRRGLFPPRWALAAALAVNEAVSADRNRGVPADRRIPRARVLSPSASAHLVPAVAGNGLTGGVLFHDAVMYSAERLTLEVVLAARAAGALVASYTEFMEAMCQGGRVRGARLRDTLTGSETELAAAWVINTAGAAAPEVARRITGADPLRAQRWSVALNLVTRLPPPSVAYTVSAAAPRDSHRVVQGGTRQLFVVPWRGQTMVGTAHLPYDGDPAAFRLREEHVEAFLAEVATASPPLGLSRDDVLLVHHGLLPVPAADASGVQLLKRHQLLDHAADGAAGALSALSVKYTTARRVAVELLDRVAPATAPADPRPFPGGSGLDRASRALEEVGDLAGDSREHLLRSYGGQVGPLLDLRRQLPAWGRRVVPGAPVIFGQLVHGALAEAARTAADLIHRRTELGPRGLDNDVVRAAAREALEVAAALRRRQQRLSD